MTFPKRSNGASPPLLSDESEHSSSFTSSASGQLANARATGGAVFVRPRSDGTLIPALFRLFWSARSPCGEGQSWTSGWSSANFPRLRDVTLKLQQRLSLKHGRFHARKCHRGVVNRGVIWSSLTVTWSDECRLSVDRHRFVSRPSSEHAPFKCDEG